MDIIHKTLWKERLWPCVVKAYPSAIKTGLWLLSITVPVSFAVLVMKLTGLLQIVARLFEPLFSFFGLPGESAIVFVTACFLNIYSCIAVIETLGLTGRTVTILALMCLISHNLPVESAVQKRTGTNIFRITMVRLIASFVGAFTLNLLLPEDSQQNIVNSANSAIIVNGVWIEIKSWLFDISYLCTKIMILVMGLMILQRVLEEFRVTHFLSRLMKYPLMILGVPHEAAFLWIVANTLGLAYGAGVIVDHVESGRLTREHANILNYHIGISHSLLEDTCLFLAIGVSVWWITIPRIILAAIVVWIKRLVDSIRANVICHNNEEDRL
jgi:spore maturation protein SpmB